MIVRLVLLLALLAWAQSAAAGFPSVADVTESQDTGDTSPAVTLPATVNAGDLLIAIVAGDTAITSFAFPAGWTEMASCDIDSGGATVAAGYRIADGTEDGGTLTPTSDPIADDSVHQVYRISAASWHGTTPPECAEGITGAGGVNPDPPSVTASWGATPNLVIAASAIGTTVTGTHSEPSGYTTANEKLFGDAGSASVGVVTATKTTSLAAEDPGIFTLPTSTVAAGSLTIIVRGTGGVAGPLINSVPIRSLINGGLVQ